MEEDDENIVDEALIADSFNMMSSMDDIIEAVLNKLSMKNLHCCARYIFFRKLFLFSCIRTFWLFFSITLTGIKLQDFYFQFITCIIFNSR